MARQRLLAIDGGGIRGIIPVSLLVELEESTQRLTREHFAFVAGTSTGAIIAAAVAAGIPAAEILELYRRDAPQLFRKWPWTLLKRIYPGYMYSSQRLRDLVATALRGAGGWAVNDAPIDLLITATGLADGKAWYFVKDKPPHNSARTGRLRLADCVAASAAEPTYFRPWSMGEPIGRLVGGGVGVAGNPVYQACVEAFYYSEPGKYAPAETLVVSLGTGRFVERANPRWLWSWLQWVLGQLLRSPGEQQTQIVWRELAPWRLYRLDAALPEAIQLDDVRRIDDLTRLGREFAAGINWAEILAGTDTEWLIRPGRTLYPHYRHEFPHPPGGRRDRDRR